jgi:hypothetical protein
MARNGTGDFGRQLNDGFETGRGMLPFVGMDPADLFRPVSLLGIPP